MKPLIYTAFAYFILLIPVNSQSTFKNPKQVRIVTTDLKTYEGMVIDITTDYIILDLSKNRNIKINTPYYLRPAGNYYRIDVEYIQTAATRKKIGVGKTAAAGAIAGMTFLGGGVFLGNQDSEDQWKESIAAAGIGVVGGGIVGTIAGLLVKKKWQIYGSGEKLAAFRDYYF